MTKLFNTNFRKQNQVHSVVAHELTSINLVINCTFSLFFSLKASSASLYSLSCDNKKQFQNLT